MLPQAMAIVIKFLTFQYSWDICDTLKTLSLKIKSSELQSELLADPATGPSPFLTIQWYSFH